MKQPKFKHQHNAHLFPTIGEVNNQPSKTIPDQSMSVKEIMVRFANGLSVSGSRVPIYEGEDAPFDGIDISKMDLADQQSIREAVQQQIQDLQSKMKDEQQKKLDKRQSEYNAWLKQQQQDAAKKLLEQKNQSNNDANAEA